MSSAANSLNSCSASKHGHAFIHSSGSISPLPFLSGEIPMPAHPAAGEYLQQLMNQQPKRSTLFRRPGVCRASLAVQTAFIADSILLALKPLRVPMRSTGRVRCTVRLCGCSSDSLFRWNHGGGASGPKPPRKRTIPLRGGTMHHDQIDNSHVNKWFTS